MDNTEKITSLWDDYQNGLSYQQSSGLSKNIPMFVRFYEGKQWASPTKNTKNLPRPVINIVKMICRSKKSAILSTPVKIIYKAENETANVEKFNNFADYIQKEIGQEALDKKAVDDGVKKGSYFYHYYWDSEARGKNGSQPGGLRCEIIDPLNIFFSNPAELDEQKQKWILIASREDIKSVRAKCDKGIDPDSIVADENNSKYGTVEQEGNELCTVLTRYFRKNGEVYWEKATRTTVINKPTPLAPDIQAVSKEYGFEEDAPNNSLPDNNEIKPLTTDSTKAYLYPIVVGNYEIREKSIYGLGEVEGIIPNQKSINFNIAMSLLNSQEVAWGKYVVHPNALKGQVITNEPGQVLTDYSGTGTGIRKMTEQAIQSQPLQLVETLTQLTRVVTGASEVMTGETLGASMSGAAIAQLQSQAQMPIEDLKDTFWLVKEKQGKVLAQFFKLYYIEKEFTYESNELKLDDKGEVVLDDFGIPKREDVELVDVFNSSDYEGMDFEVVVETTSGTKSSAAGDINALDFLLGKNLISLKTYLKCYPKDALSNKTEILKGIEEEENDKLAQLTVQLQQAQSEMQQYVKLIQSQQDAVNKVSTIIQENNKLKTMLANLYAEATLKIQQGNEQIKLGNQKIAEITQDATDFAQVLANDMGRRQTQSNI